MDASQRQKVTQQLLKITSDPERRNLARQLFCEDGAKPEMVDTAVHKVSTFWRSTPVWGAISVLLSMFLASRISFKVAVFLCWAVLWFEFVRIRAVSKRWLRIGTNILFGVILAMGLIEVMPYIQPKEQPTLDQQIDTVARRFPWLNNPPKPQPVIIQSNQSTTVEFTWEELHQVLGSIFLSGQEVPVVFHFKSDNATAHDVYMDAIVELIRRPDRAALATSAKALRETQVKEEKLFHAFRQKWFSKLYFGTGQDLQKDDEQIQVRASRPLDNGNDVPDLAAGREYLYVMGAIKWRDDTGTYETDLCSYYEGMDGVVNGQQKIVWTQCASGHSKVRRVFDPTRD